MAIGFNRMIHRVRRPGISPYRSFSSECGSIVKLLIVKLALPRFCIVRYLPRKDVILWIALRGVGMAGIAES